MSTKSTTVQPATPEQIKDALVTAFGKLFTLSDVQDSRRRCFATIINFKSPKTGVLVSDILTPDEVGEILDRIRDAKVAYAVGSVDF